jgi:predicted RNase H-like HicB family nuclease
MHHRQLAVLAGLGPAIHELYLSVKTWMPGSSPGKAVVGWRAAEYHVSLFWLEADSAWVADVPDLQSCSAFGDTPSEALAEVEKAMDAWLEVAREDGLPIPEARYRGAKQAAG